MASALSRASSASEGTRISTWLIPDLAFFVACITLFFCLVVFDGTHKLFRDSDAGWHIRTGEAILAGGKLPHSDPYSFTRSGQPWLAWEWAADVIMGAFHRTGGLGYVAGLYALLIAACTWVWFHLNWQMGGNFLIAAALASLLLSTGNIHWLARPHVFGWLFSLCLVWYLDRGPGRLSIVALITALWANLHASFFLAPLIASVYAAGHLLTPVIWRVDRAFAWKKARWYGAAAVVSVMASLVNPYGWQLHIHVLHYLANRELLDRIGEFQTFNFHAEGAAQILLTLGVASVGGVVALGQQKLAHFFLAFLFAGLALRSARMLPILALLVLPIANGAVTTALIHARNLQPRLRANLDSFLRYCENLRKIDARQTGLAWVPVVLLLAFGFNGRAGFPTDQFPIQAAERVNHLPVTARILAPDMYGGYLIYRFDGARKVYFDGRSDFYGLGVMKDYLRLIEVRPGWQQQLADVGFTHALLPVRYSLVPALEQIGWKRLYADEVAVLLEKN